MLKDTLEPLLKGSGFFVRASLIAVVIFFEPSDLAFFNWCGEQVATDARKLEVGFYSVTPWHIFTN